MKGKKDEKATRTFVVGEHVFAKVKGHPEWPGKVEEVITSVKRSGSCARYRVHFYGTHEWSVLAPEQLSPYLGNRHLFAFPKRNSAFNKGIFEIEDEIREIYQQIADHNETNGQIDSLAECSNTTTIDEAGVSTVRDDEFNHEILPSIKQLASTELRLQKALQLDVMNMSDAVLALSELDLVTVERRCVLLCPTLIFSLHSIAQLQGCEETGKLVRAMATCLFCRLMQAWRCDEPCLNGQQPINVQTPIAAWRDVFREASLAEHMKAPNQALFSLYKDNCLETFGRDWHVALEIVAANMTS